MACDKDAKNVPIDLDGSGYSSEPDAAAAALAATKKGILAVACAGDAGCTQRTKITSPSVSGSRARRTSLQRRAPGPFRDFRFLAPRTRLNAISEFSAVGGRRRLVRRVDFGECNT